MDAAAAQAGQDETRVTQFVVTNMTELLERSAYYGFTSFFSLYLLDLGYEGLAVGAISVILLAFPYVIPLLTSPLAEKLGYKPVMLVALLLYGSGFVVLSTSDAIGFILLGTTLVAAGAGGFKPVATANVAHVTAQRHRSIGYTIYYTGINIGGFLGPVLVSTLVEAPAARFLIDAAIMLSAFVLVLLLFRSPQPPQPISIGQALAKLGAIVEDPRLIVLLLVFSGFWFMYSINFSFLAPYLDRFVDLPGWFEPSLQQSYNPLIIIVFAIPVGGLAARKDPRRMMTLGVLLYCIGFTIVGFVQHVAAFFVGLFVATIGEIIAYPAFLSYIASIAPKDRIAVYQSYGFLPLFIGFFFGPILNGKVYQSVAVDGGRPELFWAVPIAVGILALVGFLATAQPAEGASRRPLVGRAALVLLLLPILFGAAAFAGPQQTEGPLGETLGLTTVDAASTGGNTQEGLTASQVFTIPADAKGNLTFTLTWSDESAGGAGTTNEPDTFRLEVLLEGVSLGKAEAANDASGDGTVLVIVPVDGHSGDLDLEVTLVSAGDNVVNVPIAGPQTVDDDNGNAWRLEINKQVEAPASS